MLRAATGWNAGPDSRAAGQSAARNVARRLGAPCDAAIVFATGRHDLDEAVAGVRVALKGARLWAAAVGAVFPPSDPVERQHAIGVLAVSSAGLRWGDGAGEVGALRWGDDAAPRAGAPGAPWIAVEAIAGVHHRAGARSDGA